MSRVGPEMKQKTKSVAKKKGEGQEKERRGRGLSDSMFRAMCSGSRVKIARVDTTEEEKMKSRRKRGKGRR